MLTMLIFMVVAMVALSYFGRRQNAKAEQAARARLEEACVPDTWVRTTSGYYAKFVEIDGDVVTLRTPQGVESMWDSKAIYGAVNPPFADQDEDEEEDVESSDELENDAENTTKEAYSDNADSSGDEKK
jgi:preprotein translocase subunit